MPVLNCVARFIILCCRLQGPVEAVTPLLRWECWNLESVSWADFSKLLSWAPSRWCPAVTTLKVTQTFVLLCSGLGDQWHHLRCLTASGNFYTWNFFKVFTFLQKIWKVTIGLPTTPCTVLSPVPTLSGTGMLVHGSRDLKTLVVLSFLQCWQGGLYRFWSVSAIYVMVVTSWHPFWSGTATRYRD